MPASRSGALLLTALLALAACAKPAVERSPSVPPSPATAAPTRYTYEVIATWPHDRTAFTQGLVFRAGGFVESTGLNGQSSLREVELKTGRVLKRIDVAREFFGEGLAVIGDRAYLLTWQHHKGFVYDVDTFRLQREFAYEGEGWGLTTDGHALILSDGTSRIRFLDPATFQVLRTIDVVAAGKPVSQLNELEWINGEIFANVWQTDEIVRIDPATGSVRGVIDFSGLLAPADRGPETDVLNGIAYDAANDRLFVTGKKWPKIFEVKLRAW
ncbi:MAG: glutaminyl-peptide cyclotransferase [Opitutus sp.]|nr:glutaminyl-peptide cyclotransferase [Opitutus sp.]